MSRDQIAKWGLIAACLASGLAGRWAYLKWQERRQKKGGCSDCGH
jgi:hypothetical protein